MRTIRTIMFAVLMTAGAPCALAQHGQAQPSGEVTVNIQGDQAAWINNPNLHAFYDLTKARFGPEAAALDFEDYRETSYTIFRALAASMGWSPDVMVEHLKDIPRQMIGIVKDDPHVLDSYDNFVVALMGPQ